MPSFSLHNADCLDFLKTMDDCSIDAIITDPPYGLSFMGKKWDYDVPSEDIWRECLRVLRPGGHLLAFAGTRTQHRMAVRIEDAGFEIRDMIAWVYGCLDEQTQLVTPDGPRPYHSAKAGDPVLCYNVETKEYNYQPIQDVVVYDYSDTAYRLVGDHGEQVVSRNHRCLVERSGSEVFQLAETLEQQARVPILENLPALQQALRNARQSTSGQEQDLQQGVRGGDHRQGQQRPHADRAAQAQPGKLRGLRRRSAQSRFMAEARRHAGLQPAMQRQAPWRGMEAARQQGAPQLATRIRAGFDRANDRRHQSRVERWADLPQPQGSLCRSGNPVRALPCGLAEHGAEGWLRDGAPATGGSGDWPTAHPGGSCASRQPRRDGQPAGEPDAVCDERPAQGIRAWSGHRTSVVRVEPFHYTGKVWCLKVPTGCFVAWRDGMAFPTGNSGFPKSLDVSKAIDRAAGALKPEGQGFTVAGYSHAPDKLLHTAPSKDYTPPAPATPEAQDWEGWGTALKPALEPITVARKPFKGTVAANVLAHGTGAINVDGCRIKYNETNKPIPQLAQGKTRIQTQNSMFGGNSYNESKTESAIGGDLSGRWPANLIHDGSDEVVELFPEANSARIGNPNNPHRGVNHTATSYGQGDGKETHDYRDSGSAARFFYCPKVSKKERGEGNTHPTLKPIALMAYLCRLVTPPNGTVLDPFMGSGSTGIAALQEGFSFVGVEREPEYLAIAEKRIQNSLKGSMLR